MDAQRFDRLSRILAGSNSRRGVIATAAAGLMASALGRQPASAQSDCPPGYALCDGVCRFLENDYNHCGGCGNSCGDLACIDGACAACESVGLTTCHDPIGGTNYCADTTSSWNDCGACGNRCTTGPCENGVCVSTADCDEGLTECMGQCVDLRTNVSHCGACGNACMGIAPPGQSSVGVCVEGECEIVCLEGYSICNDGERDFCADLATDPANCGACGTVCTEGVCTNGTCGAAESPIEGGAGDALGFALKVERTTLALLRQGLAAFDSEAFAAYPRDTRTRLGVMRDHDKAHEATVSSLLEAIGEAIPGDEPPNFVFAGVEAFLESVRRAKELSTAAYAHLLTAPTSGEPIRNLAGIAIVEGRHAAWSAMRTGEPAFEAATELRLTRAEIEQALANLSA